MPAPKFSVVIPCYNQGAFIRECLDSLAAQTLPPFEIVVVNDGSTDPWTIQCLEQQCRPPVKLVTQENRGLSGARNTGVRHATGDWILPLDADDRLRPDALATYAAAIEREPEIDIWYPDIQYFGLEDGIWECPHFNRWRQLWSNQMVCSSAISRRVFDSGITYNERMRAGYEDWAFYVVACCQRDFLAKALEAPVFLYRRWGYSMLSSANALRQKLVDQLQEEHGVYDDAARLLDIKRQNAPCFAVAANTSGLAQDLASQGFRDWHVVDESGRLTHEGDLRVFRGHLGRYLLVSQDDEALGAALRSDHYLLEKIARTAMSRSAALLALVLANDAENAYPGFLTTSSGNQRCVGWVLSTRHTFDHPDVPRTGADLLGDVAAHLASQFPGAVHRLVVGGGDARHGVAFTSASGEAGPAGSRPTTELRSRLHALGKSASQLARAIVGDERHAMLRESSLFRSARAAVTGEARARALQRAVPARDGPFDPSRHRLHRHREHDWFVANESPIWPEAGEDRRGPAVLIAVPWIVHGGADRGVLDFARGVTEIAPHVRKYVVTTQRAEMQWADQLLPNVDGVFCLGGLERPDAENWLTALVKRLGIESVLVMNCVGMLEALPSLRHAGHRIRSVVQLHAFGIDPVTGERIGHPVVAATRFNNLIDAYAVISRSLGDQLVEDLYVSPSKVNVVRLGIDVQRFAQARRPRLARDRCEVLWMGRLSGEKDPDMVLNIAAVWKAKHGTATLHFTLAGGSDPASGDLESRLRARLDREALHDMVEMVGPVTDPVSAYAGADCLLMTSRSEGIPVVIYEACAAELPVVTPTANTAIEEVLPSADAWFVDRQDDPEAYVRAFEQILANPDEARARAKRASARSGEHDVQTYARAMLDLLAPGGMSNQVRCAS
jgi:glycosyltransferase involved in cell wall biosynthesis